MHDLSLKLSELEKDSKCLIDGLKVDVLKKQEEIDLLQKVVEEIEETVHSLEKRISELENELGEKDQLVVELKAREKLVNDQKAEVLTSLADTESKLQEAKKQYDHMLESKHLELSKHLKEISQRNDQQEHANKEMRLVSKHTEELRCAELHAETELREKIKLLRSEHEAQLRALRCEHEDNRRRLQEELDLQRAKEERQKALLQLQCKVMSDNPQEDQEVTSKK
ncbi:hypothetical protein ACS0TY_017374 [Phlomoides rotata]